MSFRINKIKTQDGLVSVLGFVLQYPTNGVVINIDYSIEYENNKMQMIGHNYIFIKINIWVFVFGFFYPFMYNLILQTRNSLYVFCGTTLKVVPYGSWFKFKNLLPILRAYRYKI